MIAITTSKFDQRETAPPHGGGCSVVRMAKRSDRGGRPASTEGIDAGPARRASQIIAVRR